MDCRLPHEGDHPQSVEDRRSLLRTQRLLFELRERVESLETLPERVGRLEALVTTLLTSSAEEQVA
jgi:hypothetical protein